MEWRYLAAGINMVVFGAIILVLGLATGSVELVGIASSVLIPGIVVAALGLTYSDPLHQVYQFFANSIGFFVERVAEDTGLVERGRLTACPRARDVLVAIGASSSCSSLRPGLLVDEKGEPYIGFTVPLGLVAEEGYEAQPLELLHYNLVTRYSIARDVSARRRGNTVEVLVASLQPELSASIGRVAEPVKPLIASTLAYSLAAPVRLETWRSTGDGYLFVFSILQHGGGAGRA